MIWHITNVPKANDIVAGAPMPAPEADRSFQKKEKAMEIAENSAMFNELFEFYISKYNELKELTEDEFPKPLRLLDIRLRLALSLQIGFDNTISYTKTKTTRKIYSLILKLNDVWFAYEGLYKICLEKNYLRRNHTKSDPFTSEKVTELLLDDIVGRFGTYLKRNLNENTRLRNDFTNYLTYLKIHSEGKTQPRLLEGFKKKIEDDQLPEFNQILSLIYGIRNMYVHNTDTAKSGVRQYKTKIEFLKICGDFLTLTVLKIAINIQDENINNIE